jgi:uncharacterized protein YktB (UPF0637 family)
MSKLIRESSTKETYNKKLWEEKKAMAKTLEFEVSKNNISRDPVSQVESDFPIMTKEFKRLQKAQYDLFCKKQHDYGPGNIAVGTQLLTEEEIKLSLTGLWFRMNDKIQRLKNLLMSGKEAAIQDEPIEDAYLDVSNYGIMATIVKNGKWGK